MALIYGVVLNSARALGEFGAVSIVSGNVVGQTQALPLYVEDQFTKLRPLRRLQRRAAARRHLRADP
ncbi:MAG TPA: hypothetical protein VIY52_23310 [Streptosporangiaceae bacterium]